MSESGAEYGSGSGSEVVVRRSVLGRRRRANAAGGARGYAHKVKVTAEEEAVLTRLAAQAGVSVPRLLVEAATAPAPGVSATERREAIVELFAVSRVLAGVATNLNQLARQANAAGDFPGQAVAVRERIRELVPRISRAVADLSDRNTLRPLAPPPGRRSR